VVLVTPDDFMISDFKESHWCRTVFGRRSYDSCWFYGTRLIWIL